MNGRKEVVRNQEAVMQRTSEMMPQKNRGYVMVAGLQTRVKEAYSVS